LLAAAVGARWEGAAGIEEAIMDTTVPTSVGFAKAPWNKGRLIGQKRPLKPKDVWAIRVRLQLEGRKRDLALFNLAIDSKLRGCDLVSLRVQDVCVGGRVRDRATVIQKKTGRPVQFEITEQTRSSVREWSRILRTVITYSRTAAEGNRTFRHANTPVSYIPGSRTPGSTARPTAPIRCVGQRQPRFRKMGNLRAVRLLLGHTKLESTVRYLLGIEVDDACPSSELMGQLAD